MTIPPNATITYTTLPDNKTAKHISHQLLNEKLIACANIIPNITSIYPWEGNMTEDNEVILLLKTLDKHNHHVHKKLTELHPYETPCIFDLNTDNTHPDYINWMLTTLK